MPTVRQGDVPPDVWAKLTGTGKPARTRKPATPKAMVPHGVRLALTLPCVVVSEANRRDHWAVRRARFQGHAAAFRESVMLWGAEPELIVGRNRPVTVTLTRLGGKALDGDNLASAFKGLRDEVAGWLGVDDGDDRVSWRYGQEPGGRVGVRVELEVA